MLESLPVPISSIIEQARTQIKAVQRHPENVTFPTSEYVSPLRATPLFGERNPAVCFLARYHGQSARTHASRLKRIAYLLGAPDSDFHWLDWAVFHETRIRAFLNNLYEPYFERGEYHRKSANTLNGLLDTLRGVMREAAKLQLISQAELRAILDIRNFRNDRPLAGRMALQEETQAIEAALDRVRKRNPTKAARDRAIMRLAFLTGLRRHEFSLLDMGDLNLYEAQLRVHGKGGKVQAVELGQQVIEALREWIEFRGTGSVGEGGSALFLRVDKTGSVQGCRLMSAGIRYLFHEYTQFAGIRKITPHDARRTFCSNLLDHPDIDPKTAMDMARHSSFDTTARYDRRTRQKRKSVANWLSM